MIASRMTHTPPDEPVHLYEDPETGDRFLIYGTDHGLRVELRYVGDTLWMTQVQMAELFAVDRSVITKHIANVYEEGELDAGATSAKIALVRNEGGREVTRHIEHYNLDAVISVGYRVSSYQGTLFRRWATGILVQFATKGFVVDVARLKDPDQHDRVQELREIIRDIRASEANVYAEIRRICALCQDYDPQSEAWRDFYKNTQAKLMYAVTSLTPAQILKSRASAFQENMGLQVWSGDNITQKDVTIAKNYLRPPETQELNRLTDILLSIFEDQLAIGRLTTMAQAANLLDKNIRDLGRVLLQAGGPISHEAAAHYAKTQYRHFDEARRKARKEKADREYAALKEMAKSLPKGGGKRKA